MMERTPNFDNSRYAYIDAYRRKWCNDLLVVRFLSAESLDVVKYQKNKLLVYRLVGNEDYNIPAISYFASHEIIRIGLVPGGCGSQQSDYIFVEVYLGDAHSRVYVLNYSDERIEVLTSWEGDIFEWMEFYSVRGDAEIDRYGIRMSNNMWKYKFNRNGEGAQTFDMGEQWISGDFPEQESYVCFPLSQSLDLFQTCDDEDGWSYDLYSYHEDSGKYIGVPLYELFMARIVDFSPIPGMEGGFILLDECGLILFRYEHGKREFLGSIPSSEYISCPIVSFRDGVKFPERMPSVYFNKAGEKSIPKIPYKGFCHLPELSSDEYEFFTDGKCLATIDKYLYWVTYDIDLRGTRRLGNGFFYKQGMILELKRTKCKEVESYSYNITGKMSTIKTYGYYFDPIEEFAA